MSHRVLLVSFEFSGGTGGARCTLYTECVYTEYVDGMWLIGMWILVVTVRRVLFLVCMFCALTSSWLYSLL